MATHLQPANPAALRCSLLPLNVLRTACRNVWGAIMRGRAGRGLGVGRAGACATLRESGLSLAGKGWAAGRKNVTKKIGRIVGETQLGTLVTEACHSHTKWVAVGLLKKPVRNGRVGCAMRLSGFWRAYRVRSSAPA